jgi:orotate phosphoribosyltransferase
VIAGVATGAIAMGALVAEEMQKPFIYVRPSAKAHGRKNQVEGRLEKGQRVIVIEDLVSTGGSSLKALETLLDSGAEVIGMAAIFTYGFQVAENNFRKANVNLITLTDYPTLIEVALESGAIQSQQMETLNQWREDPSNWKAP